MDKKKLIEHCKNLSDLLSKILRLDMTKFSTLFFEKFSVF